ncbi:MAG: hypothetical protein AB7S75_09850 [Desulfococcaceae bacterium]
MSNREKITVILAFVAMLYGIYEYIFSAKPQMYRKNAEDAEDILQYIAQISQELARTGLTPFENYLIEKTEKKWEDIFMPTPLREKEDNQRGELQKIKLPVYTGYMQMGKRMIAIIDGMDYEVGESLPVSGYELIRISPQEITVRNQKKKLFPISIDINESEGPYENIRKK